MNALRNRPGRLLMLIAALVLLVAASSCDGNVYYGVTVAGPYTGYPGGPYGGIGYGGPVYVGRPF